MLHVGSNTNNNAHITISPQGRDFTAYNTVKYLKRTLTAACFFNDNCLRLVTDFTLFLPVIYTMKT